MQEVVHDDVVYGLTTTTIVTTTTSSSWTSTNMQISIASLTTAGLTVVEFEASKPAVILGLTESLVVLLTQSSADLAGHYHPR